MGLKTALWSTCLVFLCTLGACHAPMHHASHTDAASDAATADSPECSSSAAIQAAFKALSSTGITAAASSATAVVTPLSSDTSVLQVAVLANATTLYGIFIQQSDCSAVQLERTDLLDLHNSKVQELPCHQQNIAAAKIGVAQSSTSTPYEEIDAVQNADDGVELEVILLDRKTCRTVDSFSTRLKVNSQ